MNLKIQHLVLLHQSNMIKTVSLETAKLFKEAGFRQDTEFMWCYKPEPPKLVPVIEFGKPMGRKLICAAPTTDELLEELPLGFIRIERHNGCFIIEVPSLKYAKSHMELPEALAQMWLWLQSENLKNQFNLK